MFVGTFPVCTGHTKVCGGEAAAAKWLHESVQYFQDGGWISGGHEGADPSTDVL